MTKEEFYEKINRGRYPKYVLEQIKEGTPPKNCSSIVCTASDKILIAQFMDGKWKQVCFHTMSTPGFIDYHTARQTTYLTDIYENIQYWTDGEAKDYSREQNE